MLLCVFSVTPPHAAMGRYIVCDCHITWSNSLFKHNNCFNEFLNFKFMHIEQSKICLICVEVVAYDDTCL